jgi:hypothetical protein
MPMLPSAACSGILLASARSSACPPCHALRSASADPYGTVRYGSTTGSGLHGGQTLPPGVQCIYMQPYNTMAISTRNYLLGQYPLAERYLQSCCNHRLMHPILPGQVEKAGPTYPRGSLLPSPSLSFPLLPFPPRGGPAAHSLSSIARSTLPHLLFW